MNKYSKGKGVGIVTATLATVALLGVGFSTWVISSIKTETTGEVSVVADDVQYKSLKLSVTFNGGITLAEDKAFTGDEHFESITNPEGNLSVEATFTLTKSDDYSFADDFKYSAVKFSIAEAKDTFVDNKIAENGNKISRINSADLVYFNAPMNLSLESETKPTSGNTWQIKQTISFTWGNFFGGNNQSPMNFYKNGYPSSDEVDQEAYLQNAFDELKAMKTKYSAAAEANKKLKLEVSLVPTANN